MDMNSGDALTKYDIWERKLLDFSMRNPLLNINFRSKRLLQLLAFGIDGIEHVMKSDVSWALRPVPSADAAPVDRKLFECADYASHQSAVSEALSRHAIHSFLPKADHALTIAKLYRESRVAMEENGANSLFLVAGVLQWREKDRSDHVRYAPLVLAPVDMTRTGHSFRVRGEEATFNITLIEFLKKEYDIDLSPLQALPKDDEGVDVKAVLDAVSRAVADKNGWAVLDVGLMGIFHFSKFVMWRDIHTHSDSLRLSLIVSALASGVYAAEPVADIDAKDADKTLSPADLLLPIDVDSSQLEAVLATAAGQSFILHGPPGTGKSQTITNMIANALYQGKRVLFVAEKMAALDVVKQRLDKIGLSPFCLELHSNKATKKHFLQQLDAAFSAESEGEESDYLATSDRLFAQRKDIIAMVEALHEPNPQGVSLYDLITRFIAIDGQHLSLDVAPFRSLPLSGIDELASKIESLDAILNVVGKPSRSPLKDLRFKNLSVEAESSLASLMPRFLRCYDDLEEAKDAFVYVWRFLPSADTNGIAWTDSFVGILENMPILTAPFVEALGSAKAMHTLKSALASGRRAQECAASILDILRQRYMLPIEAEDIDLAKQKSAEVVSEWEKANAKWFLPRFFAKRDLLKRLSLTKAEMQQLVSLSQDLNDADEAYMRYVDVLNRTFSLSSIYKEEDWALIDATLAMRDRLLAHLKALAAMLHTSDANVVDWFVLALKDVSWSAHKHWMISAAKALSQAYANMVGAYNDLGEWASLDPYSEEALPKVQAKVRLWDSAASDLHSWLIWRRCVAEMEDLKLRPVFTHIEHDGAPALSASRAWLKGVLRGLIKERINADDRLSFFHGDLFDASIEQYRSLTSAFQQLSKHELIRKLVANVPRASLDSAMMAEVAFLKRNIKNGGRGMSIRSIIDQIPTLLPRLCPCMLMSPISVAQYIELKPDKFDIVVFDEASQMPTCEAIGAIARGNSLVVVGDPKQMPPTNLFNASAVDDEEIALDDLDSILDDCIALSMPSKYLTWHYRSKHESLIAFSNAQYYGGMLTTFPSVDDQARKVSLRYIADGIYDRGVTRTNVKEAQAIVDEIVRRASHPQLQSQSIGVVSFNIHQRDLIEDILAEAVADRPDLEQVLYNDSEPVFIKNLENVQGDERDVIIFSIGFGPDLEGNIIMNFGPLNRAGGERRLNVAVSRARHEMVVFSSLLPRHFSLKETSSEGLKGLVQFLDYASAGDAQAILNHADASDAHRVPEMIAEELTLRGYQCRLMVGRSRFKVDVAVVDPDNPDAFKLGIICDGERYRATKTVRDREVVQPQVLKGLNWRVMRVWTLDWLNRRQQVIDSIIRNLED